MPQPRPRHQELLDGLQFLARLEADGFAGRDVDLRTGARIAPDAGLARPYGEDAKAPQLNAIALGERLLHAFEHGFDRHLRLGLGDAGLVDDFVDQVQFDHKWLRSFGSLPITAQTTGRCTAILPDPP